MYETVEDLAETLAIAVDDLLDQLNEAGLQCSGPHDVVSASDKAKLREFQQGKRPVHGETGEDGLVRCPLCRSLVDDGAESCAECFANFSVLVPRQRPRTYWEKLEADDLAGRLPELGSSPPPPRGVRSAALSCPKCGSGKLAANTRGFGLGGAALGAVTLGPVGLLGGLVGAGKVVVTCLNCGHKWNAGKRR